MARAVILTGGIGSGKSSVASLLERWGAHVVDADQLAREVVEPASEGLAEVVEAFGGEVLSADGALDRAALAEVVFDDPARLARLEAIVHPRVEKLAEERLAAGDSAPLLVYEVPLPGRQPAFPPSAVAGGAPLVVVVDVPAAERHRRLQVRGLSDQQISARMAAQPTREQWLAGADLVVDNSGDLAALRQQVAAIWSRLTGTEAPVGVDG
jgi:dephospho-CoA kinase